MGAHLVDAAAEFDGGKGRRARESCCNSACRARADLDRGPADPAHHATSLPRTVLQGSPRTAADCPSIHLPDLPTPNLRARRSDDASTAIQQSERCGLV
jgi:hypothetical protein